MPLGSNIKFLRNYSGLNQTDFAKLFNLTRGKVDSYERNVAKPSITTINAIAVHYGLAIELLHSKNLNANPGLLNSGMSVPEIGKFADIDHHFSFESVCSHNTTKKHIDIMRKLFRYAKANNWANHEPFYFYRISERPVNKEPLNEHEVKLLLQKQLLDRLSKVRDVFIVQCFTGMSYSDVKRFNKEATYIDPEERHGLIAVG